MTRHRHGARLDLKQGPAHDDGMANRSPLGLQGDLLQLDTPNWEPLRLVVGEELLEWFMWMAEIALEDGVRLHAYKHDTTRHYLHLSTEGNAYRFKAGRRLGDPSHYAPTALPAALEDVLVTWWDFPDADDESIALARAAIGRARERHRAETADPTPEPSTGDRE